MLAWRGGRRTHPTPPRSTSVPPTARSESHVPNLVALFSYASSGRNLADGWGATTSMQTCCEGVDLPSGHGYSKISQ
jgi:hypothetical protein